MAARLTIALLAAASLALAACGGDDGDAAENVSATPTTDAAAVEGSNTFSQGGSVLTGTLPRLNGEPDDLSTYRGKVVLVVNTASECGFAPQFEGLEQLYRERKAEGFVILGFPADDIVGQEPRSNEEIAEFCKENFGVTFPMFSKSNVVDDPVNPLFERLAVKLGEPTYNFNKYLLNRQGVPVERFDQHTEPEDPELNSAIEALL